MEIVALIAMGALLIYQGVMNYLQHRQLQTLINKIMSRNYQDYATQEMYLGQKRAPSKDEIVDELMRREEGLPVS